MTTLCTVLLTLLLAPVSHAATYYVNVTTGDDSRSTSTAQNPATPWASINKCGGIAVAGDTCEVADGTYQTVLSSGARAGVVATIDNSGDSTNKIIIRSTNRHGAIISIPNTWPGAACSGPSGDGFCPFSGVNIKGAWVVLDGFQIIRTGSFYTDYVSVAGVRIQNNHVELKNNWIHDINRNVCHDGPLGSMGIYSEQTTFANIHDNQLNTIGRRLNGESGCSTIRYQTDHGAYLIGTTDVTIARNLFYDIDRGDPLNIKCFQSGGTCVTQTQRHKYWNNTFADGQSTPLCCMGHIALIDVVDDISIRNNIFYNCSSGYCISWWNEFEPKGISPLSPGVVITNNLTNSSVTNWYDPPESGQAAPTGGGITFANNTNNVAGSALFVNAGARDYSLQTTSANPAIDTAVDLGLGDCNGACDYGYAESGTVAPPPPPPEPSQPRFAPGINLRRTSWLPLD